MLKVIKFGGSSLADAKQFEKVKNIVNSDESRRVVVVSAPGKRNKGDNKITDLLLLCAAHIKYGVSCDNVFSLVRDRFLEIEHDCGVDANIAAELDKIKAKMETGTMSEDYIASRGEYLSAKIMAKYLGYDFLDAKIWLKFKYDGSTDKEASYEALQSACNGRRIVIPGFYGVMPDGAVKTFSRGGSDITGALAAAALDADVYENWTDVSGILMADPRIVKDPAPISHITYAELRELSYIGAQVLHEASVFPVREKNIPLNIRNTNDPDHPGTMIMDDIDQQADEADTSFITGIAGKKGYSVITVGKSGMSSGSGYLMKMLEILDGHGVNVEYIPTGIDIISLVVSSAKTENCMYSILGEIQKAIKPDSIKITEHMAIVAAVGRKMAYRPGVSGKIFATLGQKGVNIRMITQGPEEMNIIVGVEEKDFESAIKILYEQFVRR